MVAALVCNLSLGDEGPNIQGHSWIGGTNLKKKKKKKERKKRKKKRPDTVASTWDPSTQEKLKEEDCAEFKAGVGHSLINNKN